jgi:Lrp/AsnC family transcriptional regulator, regulator for asnA, asnC and gidA
MTTRSVPLDGVDRALLRALQADGRASWAELATQIGLSAPAVKQRVQRLVDSGVLQIAAVTDPLLLGFQTMAMVAITVNGSSGAVADAIGALPGVIYVVSTAGPVDIFAEVVCTDMNALRALVEERIRSVPGVVSATPHVYYDIHAHRFSWDIPEATQSPRD